MYDNGGAHELDAQIFAFLLEESATDPDGTQATSSNDSVSVQRKSDGGGKLDGPETPIAYDQPTDAQQIAELSTAKPRSPYNQFRRLRGHLSVSDIVGPVWCEVQYDYGLRQGRSRNLRDRPSVFKSSAGKEIVVDTQVAKRNDKVTKRGTAVHEKLEKELHPVKLVLQVLTNEDRWGLRLLDVVSRLETLIDSGSCRELQVFGVLEDQPVFGIIDEIRHNSDCLSLVDNKTRKSARLSSFDNTLKDRLQLMLYWRLLSDLISIEEPFDFHQLWAKLGVDPTATFSELFMQERAELLSTGEAAYQIALCHATTLHDMIEPFREVLQYLGVGGIVDRSLRLVYWTRQPIVETNVLEDNADTDVIAAVELAGSESPSTASGTSTESMPTPLSSDVSNHTNLPPRSRSSSKTAKSMTFQSQIIGTRKFFFKEDMVNNHIRDVLKWWRGERAPRGVELNQISRCNFCEYRTGCEWLEAKANEQGSPKPETSTL